ncbi:DUF6207 family protein [Streptomyces apocyni]|uniref:DUF6207 family protein n=1 Tax=Streptomyces apocyni TaxID=2654677 RepID=UPI001E3CCB2D|nr:DUF6207 family protein [Streptomyces apocyni]
MDAVDEIHLSKPGLLVLEFAAADEDTARLALDQLDELWATNRPGRLWRVPGRAGRALPPLRRPAAGR